MTTTLDTLIDSVNAEIKSHLSGGNIGIQDIFFDEIDKPTPNCPAAQVILTNATQNSFETNDPPGIVDWMLTYQVSCLFSGNEREQTSTNTRKFTNKVYNILRGQRAIGQFFGGYCLDLDITKIDYHVNVGTIEMLVRVVEER